MRASHFDTQPHVLTPEQIEVVSQRLAEKLASEADQEFFRECLSTCLLGMWSGDAANFVKLLLAEAGE